MLDPRPMSDQQPDVKAIPCTRYMFIYFRLKLGAEILNSQIVYFSVLSRTTTNTLSTRYE